MKFNRSNIPVAEENISLVAVAVRIWVAAGSVLVTIRSQSSIPENFSAKAERRAGFTCRCLRCRCDCPSDYVAKY